MYSFFSTFTCLVVLSDRVAPGPDAPGPGDTLQDKESSGRDDLISEGGADQPLTK